MTRLLWISLLSLAALVGSAHADEMRTRWKEALADGDPARRAAAAHEIANVGSRARSLGPELEQLLEDPEARVRAAAIRALGSLGHRPALPRLIDEVSRGPLWLHAVKALEGIPDEASVPALRQRLTQSVQQRADGFSNRVGEVRALLLALAAVGPSARGAERQVEALLLDPQSPVIRVAAVKAWGRLAPAQRRQAVLRQAFAAQARDELETRRAILAALGAGPAEPETLELLQRFVLDEQGFLGEAAAAALGAAAPPRDPKSRALLLRALLEDRGRVSTAAALALGQLGARDAEVLEALERVAQDMSRRDGESFFTHRGDSLHRACRHALERLRAELPSAAQPPARAGQR